MSKDQSERDIGKQLMHLFDQLAGLLGEHAGQRSCLLVAAIDHEPGRHGRGEQHEQEQHHGAAAWAVAEMALGAQQQEIAHVAKRRRPANR